MKIRIASGIIAALFLFSSASIWEGSAAMASAGYLPGRGLYAATNSFPRNTVIEITNLENNKSIRVIVAEGLDSSGLLALVSQDAAEILGMNRDSISRIRMTQPSDPIAYKRFTDGMAAGFPDYDSGAVVTENQPYAQTPYPALSSFKNDAPSVASSTVKPMLLEEEWGGTRYIEDLPVHILPEETSDNGAVVVISDPVFEIVPEAAEKKVEPEQIQAPVEITEDINSPAQREIDKLEYAIIAAEERPPELSKTYDIDPNYIIPRIAAEERPPELSKTYDIDLNYIIPGITRPSPAVIPPEPIEIPVIAIIPAPVSPPSPAQSFTINPISSLEKGSYYVQIASLSGLELVESALGHIDADYKPVVFKDGGSWYRILLGPLNQGESGAILRRFRSIGYKDSFIRQGK
jgi:hypothetical protein